MIKISYELSRQPTAAEILKSDFCSFWLKDRLKEALNMDILDVTRDVEVLLAILHQRLESIEKNDWKGLCVC